MTGNSAGAVAREQGLHGTVLRGTGLLQAVAGNDDASQLVITTFTPTPGVPEPGTWAMMIVGFGLAGGMLRNRAYARA